MKRLFTVAMMLFLSVTFAQKTQERKLDSIDVYVPQSHVKMGSVLNEDELVRLLDKLESKNGFSKFNVVRYYSNGDAVQCKVRKSVNFNSRA